MKGTLRKELKLKSGEVFPKGMEFEIIPPLKNRPAISFIAIDVDRQIKIPTHGLYHYFYQFEKIEMSDLEDGVYDSVTKTVTGEPVEPDGWDCHGFPSPLLVMEMI